MKSINRLLILLVPFLLLGFAANNKPDNSVTYEVIGKGLAPDLDFRKQQMIVIGNLFDYDEFWTHVAGSAINKPHADMDRSILIIVGADLPIDNIMETPENINVYSTIERRTGRFRNPAYRNPAAFKIIRITYNSKPIRLFVNEIWPKERPEYYYTEPYSYRATSNIKF